jgi:uracil-DNA glycosylase family 4
MGHSGKGKRKVLIVGEAPGAEEDRKGVPFIGPAGQYLEEALAEIGVDLRRDCWITNAAICRPPRNELPEKAIEYCRPNVIRTVNELNPNVILTLGKVPLISVLGFTWKGKVDAMTRWLGLTFPCRSPNVWLCPTWHPSFLMRGKEGADNPVVRGFWLDHLKQAFEFDSKPWRKVPDYRSKVKVVLDDHVAAESLKEMAAAGVPIAFDYETDRLKPDHKEATIISCAASNGAVTVAYPWHGQAITATQALIQSPVPKIASNMKFEERWTRRVFGHGVSNWLWDTMNSAHVLDSRKGITSIKFQAFLLLGQEVYNTNVEGLMESDNGNAPNRLRQAHPEELLIYNGLDALLEWKVAKIQMRKAGFKWPT